uniref:Uncharacterized protein n=1 Tax=Candidozyma auris TaxID=498019 RepID=A0A0L0NPT7_CANAR
MIFYMVEKNVTSLNNTEVGMTNSFFFFFFSFPPYAYSLRKPESLQNPKNAKTHDFFQNLL